MNIFLISNLSTFQISRILVLLVNKDVFLFFAFAVSKIVEDYSDHYMLTFLQVENWV